MGDLGSIPGFGRSPGEEKSSPPFPWNSPGQNTGVGSLSLLQGIFPTQGSNPGLLHCRQILNQLSHNKSPRILEWVAYPFSSESACRRPWFDSWVGKIRWGRARLPTPVFLGFPGGSAGKESTCNAGDPGSIPGSGRFPWRRDRLPSLVFLGFFCGSAGKEPSCNAGGLGSIPGLGRALGEGKGYPL